MRESLLARDRLVVLSALAVVTVVAWTYLARGAASMSAMATERTMHPAMGMPDMRMWESSDWVALFVMWAVMMVGMMLPSTTPIVWLVLAMFRGRKTPAARRAAVAFIAGYLIIWIGFSVATATGQVGLHRLALVSDDMRLNSTFLSGAVLVVAGAYQWSSVKSYCLRHCQSPLAFLIQHWREGTWGALIMGLYHGGFCIVCCWLLMALLFVIGAVNVAWAAAITAFVLIEQLPPAGVVVARIAGAALVAWGVCLIVASLSPTV